MRLTNQPKMVQNTTMATMTGTTNGTTTQIQVISHNGLTQINIPTGKNPMMDTGKMLIQHFIMEIGTNGTEKSQTMINGGNQAHTGAMDTGPIATLNGMDSTVYGHRMITTKVPPIMMNMVLMVNGVIHIRPTEILQWIMLIMIDP